jgi:predicted Rossmann fold nucleotide-binding protein DprA/Smf involved in DNA uptake
MEVHQIGKNDAHYPAQLIQRMGSAAPESISMAGNLDILQHPRIGLICSVQCPGSIVIKTFDLIRRLRDKGVVMIGGFHSPMERECLDILLRGVQPVIFCPAKSLYHLRMSKSVGKALAEERLLVLSFFGNKVRRVIASQGILRNDMVAALAEALFVPHASKNGKTTVTINQALGYGQKVFTFDDEANADIIASGAAACKTDPYGRICFPSSEQGRGEISVP